MLTHSLSCSIILNVFDIMMPVFSLVTVNSADVFQENSVYVFFEVRPVVCELERCMWVMLLACLQLLKGIPASGIQTAFVI